MDKLVERRFWLSLREPGCVPERKGPWPISETAKVLREFIAARPTAYIDYITVDCAGHPLIQHGPEVLQMTDGRSMSAGRKHNRRVRSVESLTRRVAELEGALEALETASRGLHEACLLADCREELAEEIDGSLLDAVGEALEWRHPIIWTDEQVAALNASQEGYGHPFTCGGNRTDDAHRAYAAENGGDFGQLIATRRGWVCPVCDYRQTWAHPEQFDGAMANPLATLHARATLQGDGE